MEIFFSGNGFVLFRTLIVAVLAYVGLVLLLRISGRRTLSKMNAFDMVVTVALGSTLATVLLSKDVTLAQGMLAFALLIGLQYVVTWSSVRAAWIRKVITGEPALLFFGGGYLDQSMKKARVTHDEVRAAVRSSGGRAMEEVQAVILETDGSFSVIPKSAGEPSGQSSLDGVKRPAAGS